MSDDEIIKLEVKISQVLGLNYKADVTDYRERIEFLKAQLKAGRIIYSSVPNSRATCGHGVNNINA